MIPPSVFQPRHRFGGVLGNLPPEPPGIMPGEILGRGATLGPGRYITTPRGGGDLRLIAGAGNLHGLVDGLHLGDDFPRAPGGPLANDVLHFHSLWFVPPMGAG